MTRIVFDIKFEQIEVSMTESSLKLKIGNLRVCLLILTNIIFKHKVTANSLGAHMKVTESSPGMGPSELILKTFI